MKSIIIEIKTFKEGWNIRIDIAEERICELEDKTKEVTQARLRQRDGKYEKLRDRVHSEKVQLIFNWISRRRCYRDWQRGNTERCNG